MARQKSKNSANLGFEAQLFKAADKLRGNMEPSDYKHVALGLIYLKHISDSFETKRSQLLADYPEGRFAQELRPPSTECGDAGTSQGQGL